MENAAIKAKMHGVVHNSHVWRESHVGFVNVVSDTGVAYISNHGQEQEQNHVRVSHYCKVLELKGARVLCGVGGHYACALCRLSQGTLYNKQCVHSHNRFSWVA